MVNLSLYSTIAVFILDAEGHRIISKYYEPRVAQIQKEHQARLATQPGSKSASTNNAVAAQIQTIGGLTAADLVNPYRTTKDQKLFEKQVWEKTKRAQGEIIVYDNKLILWKQSVDTTFYLVGRLEENELMLSAGLTAYYDAVNLLLRHQVEKKSLLENLDLVSLALNETIDDGIILETEANAIAARVTRPRADASDLQLTEATLMQVWETGKQKFAERIMKGGF